MGADSVAAGKVAGIVGFVLVMVFMVLAYGLFGLAADVALLVNVVIIGGALSVLQATLTLPGIAGIVLTIGMAVDANVLVFERIREEMRTGKTPFARHGGGLPPGLPNHHGREHHNVHRRIHPVLHGLGAGQGVLA